MSKANWRQIERGVPITNNSYFVRLEEETGFIYDDQGGYLHQDFCQIDARREITWIEYEKSDILPVSLDDSVLVETRDYKLLLRRARFVNWDNVARFRVVRQAD